MLTKTLMIPPAFMFLNLEDSCGLHVDTYPRIKLLEIFGVCGVWIGLGGLHVSLPHGVWKNGIDRQHNHTTQNQSVGKVVLI
jgi:hypothetical protein